MAATTIAAVHLVRNGNPDAYLDNFVASYLANDAGVANDLVVVLKGFDDPTQIRESIQSKVPGVQFHEIDDSGFDINAYRSAAKALQHDVLCFLNSHAQIRAAGWLGYLSDGLNATNVGAVSASASWEIMDQSTPFPNVHLRTNGFAMRRDEFLALDFGPLATKRDCNRFEAGPNSLTQQILKRDQDVHMIAASGPVAPENWASVSGFRTGDQRELLISDNRSRAYDAASNKKRRRLAKLAWGELAAPAQRDWFADIGVRLGF
ncbi:MAG: hypothetical protein AAF439_06560 [Pseudomonadota bacterium]